VRYAVFCPEDSIIVRTHFLATSTLEQTMFHYIRYCMRTELEGDATQQVATVLLRRLVAFYHFALVQGLTISDQGIFIGFKLS
jgi:hypothetical protein